MSNQALIRQFVKQTPSIVQELGIALYEKIVRFGEGSNLHESLEQLTQNDCIEYFHNQAFNVYIREKSVIHDGLAKIFPEINFEECPPELEHSCDIDYLGYIGESEHRQKAIGIQLNSKANFGNYSPSERMKASFQDFTNDFGGKAFVVFSLDGEIGNKEVIEEIRAEINRLHS